MARSRTAREPFEDPFLLVVGHTRSVVLDGDLQFVSASFDADARRPASVVLGVVQQVSDDPLEAELVETDRFVGPGPDSDRNIGVAVTLRDAPDGVVGAQRLEVDLRGAGIDAGELEEVEHHAVEAAHRRR